MTCVNIYVKIYGVIVLARKLLCCLLFLTLVLFPSCSATNRGVTRTLTAMDTVIHVTFYEDSEVYFDVFAEEIARLDRIWSVTDEKGEVFSFNQTHNTSQFSAETFRLLRESLSWCRVTDYALDVSLLPVSKLWSFGSNAPRIPNQSEIQSALSL